MDPETFIKRHNIKCFYHFTDRRNLPLISHNGGLLSLAELQRLEIQIPAPGGNRWSHDADRMRGLDNYVHLCFIDEHPMEYLARQEGRIENPVYLRIAPQVLSLEGVRFSATVSNRADAQLISLPEVENELDLAVIFTRTDWRDPAIQERRKDAKKYEILVPNRIPISMIMEL